MVDEELEAEEAVAEIVADADIDPAVAAQNARLVEQFKERMKVGGRVQGGVGWLGRGGQRDGVANCLQVPRCLLSRRAPEDTYSMRVHFILCCALRSPRACSLPPCPHLSPGRDEGPRRLL